MLSIVDGLYSQYQSNKQNQVDTQEAKVEAEEARKSTEHVVARLQDKKAERVAMETEYQDRLGIEKGNHPLKTDLT